MTAIYLVVMVHVCQANKNAWLIKLLTLLLTSNIGAIIAGYSFYFINYLKVKDVEYVIGLGFGLALHYACFGVAHFILAVKYQSMAINVPLLLNGKD